MDNRRSDKGNSSKHLNLETLVQFFGDVLDKESLRIVLQQNSGDLQLAISQLTTLTGINPLEDLESQGLEIDQKSGSSAPSVSSGTSSAYSLTEIKGDLFGTDASTSLAHCISMDVRMGKGIALEFKKRFSRIDELKSQHKRIGEVAILHVGKRFIYYLITKENYWNKPSYDDLERSLVAMRDHCVANKVSTLAMPRIGCGLDGLLWPNVKKLLDRVFGVTDIQVEIYSL
eukprot:TRINITY_DN5840_c0_g1_i1.p1 TRINITY_DN5840_c0_g1~~TRINITY_DN5840_c0_g1_i1.p1  ORF type:complete len:230 (+),score=54.06 TRINITY_DN5840_c0_g1_i1:98-787(+)